ncbi:hypothetical protein LTR49_001535 [Elasticomyces elasticus]|nr:hypothetical protein LTR49_001535 [Elasticomyces elasticus]
MTGYARRSKPTAPGHRPGREAETPRRTTRKRKQPDSNQNAEPTQFDEVEPEPQVEDVPDRGELLIGMDYGTKRLAIAMRLKLPGAENAYSDIRVMFWNDTDYFSPQLLAWDNKGAFCWGWEVVEGLKIGTIEAGTEISLLKLLLDKQHQNSSMAARVLKKLKERGHTLDSLLEAHLGPIWKAAIQHAKESSVTKGYTLEQVENMTYRLLMGVPQMWSPAATHRMTEAAHRAGIKYVTVVPEPQCAAAYYAANVKDHPRELKKDDGVLVADLGGGTADITSLQCESEGSDGAEVLFKTVCPPIGALAGSEFVNEACLTYVESQAAADDDHGSFEALCVEHLKISAAAGELQVNTQFESIKKEFVSGEEQPKRITIGNNDGETWSCTLKSTVIAGFFDQVIDRIEGCIDKQITDSVKVLNSFVITIPGGFGQSKYLLKRLKKKYPNVIVQGPGHDQVGVYQPVAVGILERFKDVSMELGWPSEWSWLVGRIEAYDEALHPDAKRNPELIEVDEIDGETRNVYDRVAFLRFAGYGQAFEEEEWHQYYIYKDQEEIPQQIYFTKSDQIKTHGPILAKGFSAFSKDAELHPDIEPWGGDCKFPVPDMKALNFKLKTTGENVKAYEVWYRLQLTGKGSNIDVVFQMALPGSKLYSNKKFKPTDVKLTEGTVKNLVMKSHSPIMRVAPS